MELHYRLSERDMAATFAAARQRLAARQGGGPASAAKAGIFALLSLALSYGVASLAGTLGFEPDLATVLFGFLAGAVMVMGAILIEQRLVNRKLFHPDKVMLGAQSLRVADDGLQFAAPLVESRYQWAAFDEVTTGNGIVLLWFEPAAAITVPDSAFASPEVRAAFLAAVQTRIAAARPA